MKSYPSIHSFPKTSAGQKPFTKPNIYLIYSLYEYYRLINKVFINCIPLLSS